MKLIAVQKRLFTMQRWLAVLGTDAGGNTTTNYTYSEDIKGTIVSGRQQTYLFTDEPLGVGDQLRLVHDAEDKPVFSNGGIEYNVYVHNSTPVVDIYGRVTNHRQVLRDTAPAAPVGGSH